MLRALVLPFFLTATSQTLVAQALTGSSLGSSTLRPGGSSSLLVHVPGDYPSVQDAIDGVPAGSRILVHGGGYTSIVIDKPVTIIGDPAPLFVIDDTAAGIAPAPIRLAGPGAGRVVLCNVNTGGWVGGPSFSGSESGIQGGGFEELHVYDCAIQAPDWIPFEGVGFGVPGIDVSVDKLLVSRSIVVASTTEGSDCPLFGLPEGAPALRTSGAIAIVLNSTIRGGETDDICGFGECPRGGAGGPGIEAQTLYHANSDVRGGVGALLLFPESNVCGQAPDGPPLRVTAEHELPSGLMTSGAPHVGQPWTLSWDPSASATAFVAEERELAPIQLAFLGWWFVDLGQSAKWWLGLPGAGSQAILLPHSENLIGTLLTVQVLDLDLGLLGPVAACVRP